jgi:cytochrome c55X
MRGRLDIARFATVVLVTLLAAAVARSSEQAPPPERQRELAHLLERDCGSCHGGLLTGGLGPALTADALRSRPDEALVATIVDGRPGTPMPAWRPFLSEMEARWLVFRLKQGDPNALR